MRQRYLFVGTTVALSLALIVISCHTPDVQVNTQASIEDVADFLPSTYVVNKSIILEGLQLSVMPHWMIQAGDKTVTVTSETDSDVWFKVRLNSIVHSSVSAQKYDEATIMNGLNREFLYSVDKKKDSFLLEGVITESDLQLLISGAWKEQQLADRKLAGELWQMIHWIEFTVIEK